MLLDAVEADAALMHYRRDGFHVVPALLGDAGCAQLRAAASALGETAGGPRAPFMNPHREHVAFFDVLRHRAIVAVLERLLAGPVSGLQSQYFPCLPGTPGFATHQDNHYVEAERDAFASAWTALDDVTAENGALIVYPGSHDEPLLEVETIDGAAPHATQAFNALRQQVPIPDGYVPATLEVARGTVIFLHGHLLHGSHANRSRRPRPAVLTTYIRRGARFRRGASARRSEIDVAPAEHAR